MGVAESIKSGKFSFKNTFIAFTKKYNWPVILLTTIVMGIFEAIGTVAFIIPGMILSVGWSMWQFGYQDEILKGNQPTVKESLVNGWAFTKNNKWNIFGLTVIFGSIASLISVIAEIVSAFTKWNLIACASVAGVLIGLLYICEYVSIYVIYTEIKEDKES